MKTRRLLAGIIMSMGLTTPAISETKEESNTFLSLGLGLVQQDLLAKPNGLTPKNDLTPSFSIGLASNQQISAAWQLENRLSLEYLQTDLVAEGADKDVIQGTNKLSNTGLWLSSALKYTSLHQDFRPFVQLDVGKVYAELDGPQGNQYGLETGFRAGIGLEFDLEKDSSVSFAVMTGDVNSLN